MEQLGRYLRRRKILSHAQIDDGLQLQVIFGVRLGTSLVECGHLSLDALGRYLAEQTGLPVPPRSWLQKPDPKAIAAVRSELLGRHFLLPLRLEKGALHVAVLDRTAADSLAQELSQKVEAYVVPELRLFYWLEKHLGIEREKRYIELDLPPDEELRPKLAEQDTKKKPREKSPEEKQREALGIRPLEQNEELLDEGIFARLFNQWAEAKDSNTAEQAVGEIALDGPSNLSALEAQLGSVPDRRGIARVAVRLASCFAGRVALFTVHHDLIQGYHGEGGEIPARIEGVLLPASLDSTLARVIQSGTPYRGPLECGEVDARLLHALRRQAIQEAGVFPVVHDERVVNLLYVDNDRHPLSDLGCAALESLCKSISIAYDRLIQERRGELE